MIHRRRWILVGGLVLAAVVLFSFFANTVIDLRDRGETYQRQIEDNVDYAVTQAEVDLLNLVVALDAYAASSSTQDRESMQTRFDVLWSRLDVLMSGDAGEWIRLVPGAIETVEQVKQQLVKSDEIIFSGEGPIAAASLSRELLALRSRLHEIVIDFAHLRSLRVAEQRDDITSLMRRAAAYFIALVVISLVILALLGLALLSRLRSGEARDLALRQAREANRASEDSKERFRDFAESSSDWFWETDENHCVKFVTGKTEKFVGGSFNDVIGKPRWEIYEADVENNDHWRSHRADLEAHRPFRDFQFHYDHEDGIRSYRSISGVPVFDASGDFQGYRGTSTDTTSQKQAELALRGSEQRFRDFAETASDWLWETDEEGRFRYISQRYFDVTGLASEDIIGKFRVEFMENSYTPQHGSENKNWKEHSEVFENRQAFRNLAQDFVRGDGECLTFLASGKPAFDEDGNFLGYRGTGTDITERKRAEEALRRSEERFRDFAETGSDWMWEMDTDLRFTFLSEAFASNIGSPKERYFGRTRGEIYEEVIRSGAPDEIASWQKHLQDLNDRRPFRDFEQRWVTPSGETRYFTNSGKPFYDASGVFLGYRGIAQNITDRKRAEEALSLTQFCVDHAGDAVFWLGEEGGFEYINEFGLRMLGYSWDELSKMCIWDVDPDVTQADWTNTWSRLASRGGHTFEAVHLTKDGGEVPVEVSTFHVDFGGRQIVCSFSRDITERKLAEEALRESEKRFQDFAEISADWYFETDADLRFTYFSNWKTAFGRPPEDILGKSRRDFLGDAYDREAEDDELRAMRAREPYRNIERRSDSDSDRWLRVSGEPILSGDGRFLGYRGATSEITELKQKEAALRENEALYTTILDNMPAPIGLKAADGRYLFVNKVFAERRGMSVDEIKGKTAVDLWPEEIAEPLEAQDRELFRTGSSIESETDSLGVDGVLRHYRGVKFPVFDEDGNIIATGSVHTDITDRKRDEEALRENEARLRTILDNAPIAIYLKDTEGRYIFSNKRNGEWYGVDNAEAIGRTTEEFFPSDYAKTAMARDRKAMETRETITEETDIPTLDGGMQHCLVYRVPLIDAEGVLLGILGMNLDITEQKRMGDQLRQAQKMEAVGQLTGGVAHDFNNLLAIIQGNISFLDRKLEDGSELKALTTPALRATRRGASLTRRLLAFSRQQALDVEPVDVGDLLRGLEDMLARSLGEDVSLGIDAEADLWPCEADAGQLEQAVINLANNARDAMPEGGTLHFEASNLALADKDASREADLPAGDYVVLATSDTGTGISPKIMDKIFDPFFTTKEVGKGSGLGLSMVYGFVEQLGGRVTARSEPGKGATFSLYLPRFGRGETIEATPAAEPPSEVSGETVLVVEDDIDLQTMTSMLLTDLGYKVIVASSGPEALLHLAAAERIDLLLTDVVLPDGMNGPEIARKAHQLLPSLKVAYMSGYAGDVLRRHDDLEDGTVLIHKPFGPEELSKLLRQALEGREPRTS